MRRVRCYVVHFLTSKEYVLIHSRVNADGKSYCMAASFFSQSSKSCWDITSRYAFML